MNVFVRAVVALGACIAAGAAASPPTTLRWKAVLLTGDDSSPAFDNARRELAKVLVARGIDAADIRQLSMAPAEQKARVAPSNESELERALQSLAVQKGDGCLVHLTSHGTPAGLYMKDQMPLKPATLARLLDKHCGAAPTVVLVSACYSGVFAGNVLRGDTRLVLTAARDDRTSFGCGVEDTHTFWDGCLLTQLPSARTWRGLATDMARCIRDKERKEKLRFSFPQAVFGPHAPEGL